jgi:CdiI immunity protein
MMNPSNHRARPGRHDDAIPVRAGEFSALEGFLAAYLHEDFREEHATPDDALAEFLEDATSDDVTRLARDWRLFQARVAPLVEGARLHILTHTLGSAWSPQHFADVEALFAKLPV